MDCDRAYEFMSLYIDDNLDEQEETAFLEHIKSCARCASEFSVLKETVECINSLPDYELPEGYHEELMTKISALEQIPKKVKKSFGYTKYAAAAACAVVMLVVASLFGDMLLSGRYSAKSARLQQEYAASSSEVESYAPPAAASGETGRQMPVTFSVESDTKEPAVMNEEADTSSDIALFSVMSDESAETPAPVNAYVVFFVVDNGKVYETLEQIKETAKSLSGSPEEYEVASEKQYNLTINVPSLQYTTLCNEINLYAEGLSNNGGDVTVTVTIYEQ